MKTGYKRVITCFKHVETFLKHVFTRFPMCFLFHIYRRAPSEWLRFCHYVSEPINIGLHNIDVAAPVWQLKELRIMVEGKL